MLGKTACIIALTPCTSIRSGHPKMKSEHVDQREFVSWFRQTWPDVRIFAIPNGGARNIIVAAKLKAEGVSAGVPDLHVPAWNLWIEMKRGKRGKTSAKQDDWIAYLEGIGHTVLVCHGVDEAKSKVKDFFENV